MNEIKVTSLFTLHEGIRKRSTQYGALRVSAGAAPPRALGRPPAGSGTTLAEPRPSPSLCRSRWTAAARLQLPSGHGVGFRPRRTAASGCRCRCEAAWNGVRWFSQAAGWERLRDLAPSGREASGAERRSPTLRRRRRRQPRAPWAFCGCGGGGPRLLSPRWRRRWR